MVEIIVEQAVDLRDLPLRLGKFRSIEPYHVNQAIRTRGTFRRARYGAYLVVGRDETGRQLLVVFHLRGNIAHIATARRVN